MRTNTIIIVLLALIAGAFLFTGCSDNITSPQTFDVNELDFSAVGGMIENSVLPDDAVVKVMFDENLVVTGFINAELVTIGEVDAPEMAYAKADSNDSKDGPDDRTVEMTWGEVKDLYR